MKALTFAAVCLLSSSAFSQDMGGAIGGQMAAQSAMDAGIAAQQAAAAAMQAQQAQQQLLLQQQAQQAEQVRQEALKKQAQDGQLKIPVANPTPVPSARPVQQTNQAVAPAVFYESGDKTVTPRAIEVDVPVYKAVETKVQVQKIYTEIKDSQFFLEVNPFRLSGVSENFESNRMTPNDNPEYEYDISEFKAKLMPLDFKFGFENQGWGSFAEVEIHDGSESSEITLYSKYGSLKLGAGLSFSTDSVEAKTKQDSVTTGKGTLDTVEIAPYFYLSFLLVNDDSMVVEQWNKIGGSYVKAETGGLKIKGASFIFNPALDIMFKINPKLQIGTGVELGYQRFSGDVETDTNKYSGVGDTFGFELNLIKTKFLF